MVLAAPGRSVPHLKYNRSVARPTDHFTSFISSHLPRPQLCAMGHLFVRGSKDLEFLAEGPPPNRDVTSHRTIVPEAHYLV